MGGGTWNFQRLVVAFILRCYHRTVMHAESIKELLHTAPFAPFQVHVADGKSYLIDHPDLVWFTQGGRTMFVATGGERFAMVDTMLISRAEPVDSAHPPNS